MILAASYEARQFGVRAAMPLRLARELCPWLVVVKGSFSDYSELSEQVFDDIAERAAACRFRDCRHEGEPGCAVRGVVPEERLRNWAKLQREARRDTLSALERKAQIAVWKARARGARARMQAKRG